MTATDANITDWDGEGSPPIYDTDRLLERINAIPPDRQRDLSEAWLSQSIGLFPPGLVTAERYMQVERLVNRYETPAPVDFEHNLLAQQLYSLPEHIYKPATEALRVYAGMEDPRAILITSIGRLNETRRIVSEAVAYAEQIAAQATEPGGVPSVADLPPVDDAAPQIASDVYPGPKADVKTVQAWVEEPLTRPGWGESDPLQRGSTESLNRAARAYAMEQDRSTPRKKLSAWLIDRLGPDGLAKVQEALATNAVPPLDLGSTPPLAVEPSAGAAGTPVVATEDVSGEAPHGPPVEATPVAPAPIETHELEDPDQAHADWVAKVKAAVLTEGTDVQRFGYVGPGHAPASLRMPNAEGIADALDLIAAGVVALGNAIRNGEEA